MLSTYTTCWLARQNVNCPMNHVLYLLHRSTKGAFKKSMEAYNEKLHENFKLLTSKQTQLLTVLVLELFKAHTLGECVLLLYGF